MSPRARIEPESLPTEPFEAPKYGVTTRIPADWPLAVREKDDRVFVASIPQDDPGRPGVAACELGLAPETLEDYRTRIDASARQRGRPSGKLASNRLIKDGRGERLETVWEFHPSSGGFWHEVTVRIIAHRQLYSFILNVEDARYAAARPAFDALVAAAKFTPPNTGADLLAKASNRWVQREYKFALDLPEGWSPVLAPSEVALLFADGPAHGVWSDNVLVLAHPRGKMNLKEQAKELPDLLKQEDPNCEIVSCKVDHQGAVEALETVVRTRRGPFSMTVIERRFPGSRFDYEVKYTLESSRFDALAPIFARASTASASCPGRPRGEPARPRDRCRCQCSPTVRFGLRLHRRSTWQTRRGACLRRRDCTSAASRTRPRHGRLRPGQRLHQHHPGLDVEGVQGEGRPAGVGRGRPVAGVRVHGGQQVEVIGAARG